MDKVSIAKCEDYNENRLLAIADGFFTEFGIYDEIKEGMTVVIKPNLIMKSKPEEAIITHPALVEAVGKCVQKAGASVLIAESSGGVYTTAMTKSLFAGCGYTETAERNGFELYTECESEAVYLPKARICRTTTFLKPYISADYIINIAKLKTHGMTMYSGAVKNLFGAVPGLMKPELHCRFPDKNDFADMLVDICDYLKPSFNLIDGIFGMEGNGPTGGSKRFVGAVFASKSPYAVDFAATAAIGFEPREIPMLRIAAERGLASPEEVEISGAAIEEIRVPDYKKAKAASNDFVDGVPGFMRPLVSRIARPKPAIDEKKCIGCGKCAESCPQHVIKIENKVAKIDLKGCIRCFCCHEMCPEHIIKIKRLGLFNL